MPDYTIRQFQTNLPWTIRYSNDFRSSSMTHKDFAHTLHHVSKAAGKLHALADDMDHDRTLADKADLREQHGKYIADLVICALRLANTFPGGVIDLQREVHERIEGKNGVTLPAAPCINCGMKVDPKCGCSSGRAVSDAAQALLFRAQRDAAYEALDALVNFAIEEATANRNTQALEALLLKHGVHERVNNNNKQEPV